MSNHTLGDYMRLRHLPTAEAAHRLGKHYATVSEYRRIHPETAYCEAPAPVQRPGTIKLAIPMADPCRSSSVSSVPTMHVTLPAPPWGGTFERHGVKA